MTDSRRTSDAAAQAERDLILPAPDEVETSDPASAGQAAEAAAAGEVDS
jgi:hypothetical protein